MVHSSRLLYLAVAALSTSAFAQDSIEAQLQAWKQQPWGQQAMKNRWVPKSSTVNGEPMSNNANTNNGGSLSPPTEEEKKRFAQALADIEQLKKDHPQATFSVNNPFALLTHDEFLQYVTRNGGGEPTKYPNQPAPAIATNSSNAKYGPASRGAQPGERVDWQERGCVVQEIRDQGQCGACWAFSAAASIESGICVATNGKTLPSLSPQQLISCDNRGQNLGCGGGYTSYSMEWIAQQRGGKMCSMDSYPFASRDGNVPSCNDANCHQIDLGVTGFESVRQDPGAMEDAVRERPVTAFVYSGSRAFQLYSGGILTGDKCDKSGPHSVLAVGFGEENGLPYWRLKNQWSANWGEQGYVRIQRRYGGDPEGACGVELYAAYPTFDRNKIVVPQPAPVPEPQPAPEPAPEPQPAPAPEPEPTPAPVPERTNAPQPEPTRAPIDQNDNNRKIPSVAPIYTPRPTHANPAPSNQQCGRTVEHGVDYLGNDIANVRATSADACCALCHDLDGCNAFTFTDFNGGTCWLKSRAGLIVPKPGAISISLHDISKCTHQCTPSEVGYDYPGNDVGHVQADAASKCCDLCQAKDTCHAYTWTRLNGGTCWLKSKKPAAAVWQPANQNDGHESAVVYKCQKLSENVDFQGQDIGHARARSPESCCAMCRETKGCTAFSWSPFENGTCWFKANVSKPVPTFGVVSAKI